MNESKIGDIIRASVENIKSTFDANTIIGEAITTANGTVVIPVSKLTMGFVSGGVDYTGKNPNPKGNFGGGGGTGVAVTPVAFLVISADGHVNLLNVNEQPKDTDPIAQIIGAIERSPELIDKIKTIFSKKNKTDETESTAE